jgi:hypothetical protein
LLLRDTAAAAVEYSPAQAALAAKEEEVLVEVLTVLAEMTLKVTLAVAEVVGVQLEDLAAAAYGLPVLVDMLFISTVIQLHGLVEIQQEFMEQ